MWVDVIAGTRPNFVKVAALIAAHRRSEKFYNNIKLRFIHTGQHFDYKMSGVFFDELGLPEPDKFMQISSQNRCRQTAEIMIKYNDYVDEQRPDLAVVVGDVTSTVAVAVAANNLQVKVAHVEAGIRSYDKTMPEEVNRIITDTVSDLYFTTSHVASQTLIRSCANVDNVFFVGNTMIDTLLTQIPFLKRPDVNVLQSILDADYLLLTMHRPGNVDDKALLLKRLLHLSKIFSDRNIIFPIHPRTKSGIENYLKDFKNIIFCEPLPYLEFNWLIKNAQMILTDSGGITEEATIFKVPCFTLRDNTERPETVEVGSNKLVGSDILALSRDVFNVSHEDISRYAIPEKWDGFASRRIWDIISRM